MPSTDTQVPQITLDLIQTLAIAGLIFLTGMLLKKKIPVFERLNIPSAVLGGLVFAAFKNSSSEIGSYKLKTVILFRIECKRFLKLIIDH